MFRARESGETCLVFEGGWGGQGSLSEMGNPGGEQVWGRKVGVDFFPLKNLFY